VVRKSILHGFFEFKVKAACPLLDSLSDVIILHSDKSSQSTAIKSLIDLMISELKRQEPGFYVVINQFSCLVFVEIIRQQIKSGEPSLGLLNTIFDS